MDWVHSNEQQGVKITPEFPQSGTPHNQIVVLAPTTPEFNLSLNCSVSHSPYVALGF